MFPKVYLRMYDHAPVYLLFMQPIAILLITSYFSRIAHSIETKLGKTTLKMHQLLSFNKMLITVFPFMALPTLAK